MLLKKYRSIKEVGALLYKLIFRHISYFVLIIVLAILLLSNAFADQGNFKGPLPSFFQKDLIPFTKPETDSYKGINSSKTTLTPNSGWNQNRNNFNKINSSSKTKTISLNGTPYTDSSETSLSDNGQVISTTFYQFGLLSDDLISYGITPSYSFYIPVLPQYNGASLDIHIGVPGRLKDISYLRVLVDDSVYKDYSADSIPSHITLSLPLITENKFIKVTIEGYLRLTRDVCDDINSRATYLKIYKDSKISFDIKPIPLSLSDLFNFYQADFLIDDNPELFPMAYYLTKYSKTNLYKVRLVNSNENFNNPYYVYKSQNEEASASGNILYVSNKFLDALPYYSIALNDSNVNVLYSHNQNQNTGSNKVSFKELGLKTYNLEGELELTQNIPLDTGKIGGLPENLEMYLHITHTPLSQSQNPSLRIYLNNILIDAFPMEGHADNTFKVSLPSQYLKYGLNNLRVSLVLSVASDACLGSIPKTAMSILDDSYFKWDHLSNNPETIDAFVSALSRNVLVLLQNKDFDPYVLKFLSQVGKYNKNINYIKVLDWDGKSKVDSSGFDFVIAFCDPDALSVLSSTPVKLNAGDFEIFNPLTGKSLFKADYLDGFGILEVARFDNKPTLVFSFYKDSKSIFNFDSINFKDYYKMLGNVSVVCKGNHNSYNIGNTLQVKYARLEGFAYYWERFKLLFIIIIGAIAIYFIFYMYKKLTKPPEV